MPAKAKVTKEMIADAAFAVACEAGAENINARTVSERLHCSTQPVMYHFSTIEELKRTVYAVQSGEIGLCCVYCSEALNKNYGGIYYEKQRIGRN